MGHPQVYSTNPTLHNKSNFIQKPDKSTTIKRKLQVNIKEKKPPQNIN